MGWCFDPDPAKKSLFKILLQDLGQTSLEGRGGFLKHTHTHTDRHIKVERIEVMADGGRKEFMEWNRESLNQIPTKAVC